MRKHLKGRITVNQAEGGAYEKEQDMEIRGLGLGGGCLYVFCSCLFVFEMQPWLGWYLLYSPTRPQTHILFPGCPEHWAAGLDRQAHLKNSCNCDEKEARTGADGSRASQPDGSEGSRREPLMGLYFCCQWRQRSCQDRMKSVKRLLVIQEIQSCCAE